MRILIIEDEQRAANQLIRLLNSCKFDHTLEGVLDTVVDAVLWFKNNPAPELIFMDIQLADGLSFEIFQHVDIESPIIFTTAFDQYAIQAFKVNSIDYLLKPIQEAGLQTALNQFEKSKSSPTIDSDIINQLLKGVHQHKKREGILVKEGRGFIQIKLSDILYFYAEDSLVFGVSASKRYLVDETIDRLFNTLDSSQFYKINRGQIVSKISIQKIHPYFNHRVKLDLKNSREMEFIVSRGKTSEFKDWMNQ